MPHGGYHGTVVMGGNIIQQGDDKGGIQGGLGQAALNIPVNQPAQTAAEAKAAREKKQKEIEESFPVLSGKNIFTELGYKNPNLIDGGVKHAMVPKDLEFATSIGADDVKARAQRLNFQNQLLNNLLIAEQQAKNRENIILQAGLGTLNPSDLTGTTGGPFGLNIPFLGAKDTTISPIGEVMNENPFTGEKIPEQVKAREGLTTQQYNQFISDLYDANPQLYQETFPFASGQVAKPIIARIGEGIMGIPGASELAQMGGDVVGAMISPFLFTGETKKTPKIKYDNQGNIIDIISQAPDGGGTKEGFKPSDRKLPYIHSGKIPAEYLDGFTKFYQNYEGPIVGGAAITPVTLPDGSVIEFGDTGSARVFREYLESIGATQPEKPSGLDAIIPQKKIQPFDIRQFYSSLPQYTQQGIMNPNLMSYYQNLGMFPGMAV